MRQNEDSFRFIALVANIFLKKNDTSQIGKLMMHPKFFEK